MVQLALRFNFVNLSWLAKLTKIRPFTTLLVDFYQPQKVFKLFILRSVFLKAIKNWSLRAKRFTAIPASWNFYTSWYASATRVTNSLRHKDYAIFCLNLRRSQMHFTILNSQTKVYRAYSLGVLLKLHKITIKHARRQPKRGLLALKFFKRYLKYFFKKKCCHVVIVGYKKKFNFFINTAFLQFAKSLNSQILFLPKVICGHFIFRRIKSIKKRIKKRIKKENLVR